MGDICCTHNVSCFVDHSVTPKKMKKKSKIRVTKVLIPTYVKQMDLTSNEVMQKIQKRQK